ncbi:MAG: hypothetical protein H6729_10710 [Deltaproteobacteria bacterium]|nr:hypothetical protein [Deltaproteobacteria bacterium]
MIQDLIRHPRGPSSLTTGTTVAVAATFAIATTFSGCNNEPEVSGGITAALVFEDAQAARSTHSLREDAASASTSASASASSASASSPIARTSRALSTSIERLVITALTVDGSTLAQTILASEPAPGTDERLLNSEGGTWVLDEVPAGANRILSARAYLGPRDDPRLSGALAYQGQKQGILVQSGRVTDIGRLVLSRSNVQIPELDFEPPDPPSPITIAPVAVGEGLTITFARPPQTDTAGFVIALSEASANAASPTLARGREVQPNEALTPEYRVVGVVGVSDPPELTVTGLQDGVFYKLLAYAFDSDLEGHPLNYSEPAPAFGEPKDSVPPGAIIDLATESNATTGLVTIEFTSPAEDGDEGGAPATYQVRATDVAIDPTDSSTLMLFDTWATIEPPAAEAPGTKVRFERSLAGAGLSSSGPFSIAVRAVDRGGNLGPIAAVFTEEVASTPAITAFEPMIALAGREILIRGTSFGRTDGTIELASTSHPAGDPQPLTVLSWQDDAVRAQVPDNAESGRLVLTRADDEAAERSVSVVARVAEALTACETNDYDCAAPFEFIGAAGPDGSTVSALYREVYVSNQSGFGLDRFVNGTRDDETYLETQSNDWTVAVTGTYLPKHDLFAFVSASHHDAISSIFLTTDPETPNPIRLDTPGDALEDADSVALIADDGTTGNEPEVPALLALTRSGEIQTATVTNLKTETFAGFYTYPADSSSNTTYDHVRLIKRADGTAIMAARQQRDDDVDRLVLFDSDDPSDIKRFVPRVEQGPPVGDNFELLVVPDGTGSDRVAIVYEDAVDPNKYVVRILWLEAYGDLDRGALVFGSNGLGSTSPQRLEDAGLVIREGEIVFAVLASTVTTSATLYYLEATIDAVDLGDASTTLADRVVLDTAAKTVTARMACKPFPQVVCPMAWLGPNTQALFIRQ